MRRFAVCTFALLLALLGAGTEARAPQALRASVDVAAEVVEARPAQKRDGLPAVALRGPPPLRPSRIAAVPPLPGTQAWPPHRDLLALKHARLI